MTIDLDQLLADAKTEKVIRVVLKNDDLPFSDEQAILCKYPKLKKYERRFKRYYGFRFFADEEDVKNIEGTTKDNALGFAVATIESDAYDWEGFKGEFNAKILVDVFEEYPAIGKAFAEAYIEIVEKVQKERLEKFAGDEKNSEPM